MVVDCWRGAWQGRLQPRKAKIKQNQGNNVLDFRYFVPLSRTARIFRPLPGRRSHLPYFRYSVWNEVRYGSGYVDLEG